MKKITDELSQIMDGKFQFEGVMDSNVRWLEKRHLRNEKMWKLFVNQFRLHSDSPSAENHWVNGWRGEYWGKSMRGAVATYTYTKNEELYNILTRTVKDMLSTQDEFGRFSTYEIESEFGNWDIWCRKYVLLGMQYYYDICRDEKLKKRIVKALSGHLNYIMSKIGSGEDQREITLSGLEKLKGINASSILEPVVKMYYLTGETKYLDYAEYIVDCGGTYGEDIFELAYEGKKFPYEYTVTKAYEMMSCFEGLLELYRATGNEKYKVAVENFVELIRQSDVTILGSCGCRHEFFDNSTKTQTDVTNKLHTQETCVTVTWMKLCLQMLLLTSDAKYADEIEKSAYNALAGAVNTEECLFDFASKERYRADHPYNQTHNGITDWGMPFDSYSPLLPGKRGCGIGGLKKMQGDTYYGCCAAIGGAGTGLPLNTAFLYSQDGIVINFYYKGVAELKTSFGNRVKIITDTEYPADGKVKINILCEKKEAFTVKLRIPEWSRNTNVLLNGKQYDARNGSYMELLKEWENDVIEISFAMNAYFQTQDGFISIKRGPIVMARDEAFGGDITIPVHLDISKEDIELNRVKNLAFSSDVCFEIQEEDGSSFLVCDYASAGKVWDAPHRIAAWFPYSVSEKD